MYWFWDNLRKILIGIDVIVYGLVEQVLQTIVDLSNVQIFTDVAINEFSRRIYIILGLVMVFKVMMSFIQILINPDSMSDKEKGAGNILKRVVIALALIVFVPSIFKMARDVQGYVLPIIPKVILGIESSDTATDPISQSNIGSAMAWYSFLPFFDYANETCDTGTIQKIVSNDTTDYEINSVGAAFNHITDKDACNNGDYKYTHKYLVSTLVGAYLLFSLVQIAIQIAIRALKLGICEFVAPIPIASYIDPKTSKSTFDKWVSTSIKVYLDLFIQLIAVYFVVFVFITIFDNASISSIVSSAGNNWWRASLIVLFIIVGLLKFVKEFPKFLSGLLGISTDVAIGSIFKNAWVGAKETAGFAKNLVKAPISNVKEMKNTKYADGSSPTKLRIAGSALGGVLGVTGHTIAGKISGKQGKELTQQAFSKTTNKRNERISNKNSTINGYGWKDRMADKYKRSMNISADDDWAETSYGEHSTLANIMSDAGALGLKKGEERDYDISTNITGSNLARNLGTNSMKYSALKQIATFKEGDLWDGRVLTSTQINEAADFVKKQQKNNKIDFFARLIRENDAGAVEIRNKLVDHIKNSPAYNDEKMIEKFAEDIFGTASSVNLDYIDEHGTVTSRTYNRADFNKKTLEELAKHCLVNTSVQSTFKNVSETARNEAQTKAAEAKRRNKARADANKNH